MRKLLMEGDRSYSDNDYNCRTGKPVEGSLRFIRFIRQYLPFNYNDVFIS